MTQPVTRLSVRYFDRRSRPSYDVHVKPPTTSGETLADALHRMMPEASRRTLKQLVEHGRVRIDGRAAARLDATVAPGASIEITERIARTGPARPLPTGLTVVYSDEHVIVVEKPAGMLTIATEREKDRTVYARIREHVKAENPRDKIFIVHRLDRLTSGLLVFAKNETAKRKLQDAFAEHKVDRIYSAVVEGNIHDDEGEMRSFLVESTALRVHVSRDENRGIEAITRYRVLRRGNGHSLVEVNLVTGRKAQIRVQFAHAGHPVVGDRDYGTGSGPIGRLALHATRLAFVHPASGRRVSFVSRPPRDFAALVKEEE
jgi:23S rRNA pseudouridine1911/1915/1917 synthase